MLFFAVVRPPRILGIRGILVHAISEEAKAFYERYGFTSSPQTPYDPCHVIEIASESPYANFNSFAALSFKISGRTSSLMLIFSKSASQRSGDIIGQSEPKSILCFNSVLA